MRATITLTDRSMMPTNHLRFFFQKAEKWKSRFVLQQLWINTDGRADKFLKANTIDPDDLRRYSNAEWRNVPTAMDE